MPLLLSGAKNIPLKPKTNITFKKKTRRDGGNPFVVVDIVERVSYNIFFGVFVFYVTFACCYFTCILRKAQAYC